MQVTSKSNIRHDGETYEKGQTFEVSEKQAADLLAAGVIEEVKGVQPTKPEEAPESSLGTPDDKNAERKGVEEVANLPVDKKMKKEKLRGIALAMGIEVEKTATGPEIYEMIVSKRGGEQPEGEESQESSNETETMTASEGGSPSVPANPAENAPAQNTTDTDRQPAPDASKKSK